MKIKEHAQPNVWQTLRPFVMFLLLAIAWQSFSQDEAIEEVVVTAERDYFSILPNQASDSSYGLIMSLVDTPRSVSEVREDLIQKFALRSVDDLVRLTPGAFTSSFFGIRGAMDIRGEPADNYFRGFRRIANPGAFNTIVRGAQKLEILRGPVSPLYGTGSIGGQLNYIPKSARSEGSKYISGATGDIGVTLGSYKQRIVFGEFGMPFTIGDSQGGFQLFAEIEDSESFYDFYEPSSELLQVAFDIDVNADTTLEFGLQYQSSDSIQVPGWTRVTQDLIDTGTYITGNPPSRNRNGGPDLRPNESGFPSSAAGVGINDSFTGVGTFCVPFFGFNRAVYNGQELTCFGGNSTPWLSPLENVGSAKIDHSRTFIDPMDYADTDALTLYFDVTHTFDNSMVWRNQFFYDYMEHTKFQSWGFTALYPDATIFELRSSLSFEFESDAVLADNVVGFSFRREDLDKKHAYFDETFDFRDMIVGATPEDRITNAVLNPFEGVTFNTDADGNNTSIASGDPGRNFNEEEVSVADNFGIFFLSNIEIDNLIILLGARYDNFDVEAEEIALTLMKNRWDEGLGFVTDSVDELSYNISMSYRTDSGFVPYVTRASANSLNANQLGGVIPSSVPTDEYLAASDLTEIGFKFSGFDDRIYAAFSYFDQEKTERSGQLSTVTQTYSEGYEFELRGIITDELSIIATATQAEVDEVGNIFTVINGADFAAQNGLLPAQVYGGRISADRDTLTGPGAKLERGGLPDRILSIYGTWNSELYGGEVNASIGFTAVEETYMDAMQSVLLPSYVVWTGSVGYINDRFSALMQVNNLGDEEYYTSADLFESVVVKPSEGRTVSLTVRYALGE
ncbi:MAG: TonB-dependent receptor [Pseudomonadota bacterium]|nr:TonB-dependent receptor [Pseudomonadota bacterium]